MATTLSLTAGATAARSAFPVPSCAWVSAHQLTTRFGVAVRKLQPVWVTDIGPILGCGYVQGTRITSLKDDVDAKSLGSGTFITVQFRELQRFKTTGFQFVKGLGSCIGVSSCPMPGESAWLRAGYVRSFKPYFVPYIDALELRVEDGLNAIVITVDNGGRLPIHDEVAQVEGLARSLLHQFYWS